MSVSPSEQVCDMTTGTPRGGDIEREFVFAGRPDGSGKVRELPVVTALPLPETSVSECTRVEHLIFEDAAE